MAKQLTVLERERISQMHDAGAENVEIARELGRAHSTISRELRRNALAGEYSAMIAQGLCLQRRRARPLVRKMDRPEVADYVREHLVCYWSPDQIAGRSKCDFPDDDRRRISHQTIYAWIGTQPTPQRRHFTTFLRRGGRGTAADDRRGQHSHQVSIEGRPKVVSARRRYGDWEGDTVVGARHSRRRVDAGGTQKRLSADGQELRSQSRPHGKARSNRDWVACRPTCDARRRSTMAKSLQRMSASAND